MLQLGGFSAWIKVENVETQEYNIEISDDGKNITCWIASEVGKHFSIHWRDSIMSTPTCGRIFLDGSNDVAGKFLNPDHMNASVDAIFTSSTTTRPILFSSLELTDDDSYLNSANAQHIGQIGLKIWRIASTVRSDFQECQMNEQKVHERSKKGITHRVKLGEELQHQSTFSFADPTYLEKEPIVTFSFKYRSLEFLRATGIAPSRVPEKRRLSVSPERETKPEVNDDNCENEEDPDLEEVKLLEERLKAAQARLAKKGNKAKRVKRETRPVFVAGEVIDLT